MVKRTLKERIALSYTVEIKTVGWPYRMIQLERGEIEESDLTEEEVERFHKKLTSISNGEIPLYKE